ncbi:hypothetical protein [Nocardioides sp.]|uniref:hypothetical protein n=1 Tax=Nocardioides sp. TaxID=35761 RepID=UPI0027332C15|nr:hypothetical protein [Nocardioides sp.]MDP3890538.1 hypothetical protein [Nocardioides sp.]
MVTAVALLAVAVLAGSVALSLFLRSWGVEESRVQARLRDPHTSTVAFAIPNGIDPVILKLALTRAGFTTAIDRVGDAECLRVECAESERAQVRRVIKDIHRNEYDGSEVDFGRVVFEDEH